MKGRYVASAKTVKPAWAKRLEGLKHPYWAGAMAVLIKAQSPDWFRWFDAGDIQDMWHYLKILTVCRLTPDTKHWLSTQERTLVKRIGTQSLPSNLVVRVSSAKIDGPPDKRWPWTSVVVSDELDSDCPKFLIGRCPAQCRRCWDQNVDLVKFKEH